MANPSLQIGNDNWAIKEDNLLGYSTAGTRFVPQPITMTRATLGTRVNPSGLVEDVALLGSELVTDGNFPSGTTAWTFGAGWSLGTNKAERLVAASSTDIVQASVFPNLTSTFKISFDVVRSAGSIRLRAGTYSLPYVSATDTYIYYVTPVSNDQLKFQADSSFVGSITNISVKEATIDNLPRVDYTDGTSSLLVEPQRTNGIPYSEDFSQPTWIASNQTVSLSEVLSPNGTSFSYKLTATANYSKIREDLVLNATTTYIVSFYTKNISAANPRIVAYDQNNAVTLLSQSYGSELSSSEWVRITGTFTTTTAATIQLQICRDLMDSEEMLIWGAQLEAGSYPTSYIPTSGSTVTRNQETYEKTGISDLINSEEGVLFVEMAALVNADATNPNRGLGVSSGSTNNTIFIYFQSSTNQFGIILISGGTTQFTYSTTSFDVTSFNKVALKYKQNDFALWVNGVEVATDSSGNTPTGLSKLSFDNGAGNDKLFGKVKQLQIFKTALSDSELATLTT